MPEFQILVGDAIERTRELEDESVQQIVTSPPYWRQRDYKIPSQIGLEGTPEEYCARLVSVFREARRVLRSDGTLWLNLGDKWASGGNGGGGKLMEQRGHAWDHAKGAKGWKPPAGYKDKDLVGIPWMVAFALRADGWYLRQCNVWAKPNCMPESVSDRSTISHEYVFHLSKSNDYFYDAEAARTQPQPETETRIARAGAQPAWGDAQNGVRRASLTGAPHGRHALGENLPASERRKTDAIENHAKLGKVRDRQRGHSRRHDGFNDRWDAMEKSEQQINGANLRSVWWISPAQYGEEHYAVMPERLAEICIAAGSKENSTVWDPFCGSGTTGVVALRYHRNFIGIELNPEYAAMAERRIRGDQPLFNEGGQIFNDSRPV